jgi:hypothetical protein
MRFLILRSQSLKLHQEGGAKQEMNDEKQK